LDGLFGYYTASLAPKKGYEVGLDFGVDDIDLKGWFPSEIKVPISVIYVP